MNGNKREKDCFLIEVIAVVLIFVLLSFILHQHWKGEKNTNWSPNEVYYERRF